MRSIVVLAMSLGALAVPLTGCGYYHWHKDGADSTAFQRDSEACQQQTGQGGWQSCMNGKGWIYSSGW